MKYINTISAKFIDRPNRFIAHVQLSDGGIETVHVKNTGRCKELLIPGVEVILQDAYSETTTIQKVDEKSKKDEGKIDTSTTFDITKNCYNHLISNYNPSRKTRYDLIAVKKKGMGWINIDSQVPNKVVHEWLLSGNSDFNNLTVIRPEYKYGDSRVDFYLENEDYNGPSKILMEVKGCTLEINKKGYFPDAPTKRGAKHLVELAEAAKKGYKCYLVFVIAMNGISQVYPNVTMDPEFSCAYEKAIEAGVKVVNLSCRVSCDEIEFSSYTLIN